MMNRKSKTISSVSFYRWLIVAARITNQTASMSIQRQEFLKADVLGLRKIVAADFLVEDYLKHRSLLLIFG